MLRHEDIWRALDRLAAENGLSASGLARKAGLDPTTFNRSKRLTRDGKARWPSTESLAKVLEATGDSFSRFAALAEPDPIAAESQKERRLPLIAYHLAANGALDPEGRPARADGWEATTPPDLCESGVFAVEIEDDALEPVYRAGDMIIVSPDAEIRVGDRVLARTRDGGMVVKRLKRRTADRYDLTALAPGRTDRSVARSDLQWMARIIWASQ